MIKLTIGEDENENENVLREKEFANKIEMHDYLCGLDYFNAVIVFGQDKDDDDLQNPLKEEFIITERLDVIQETILSNFIFDFETENLRFFLYVCDSWEDAYNSALDMREKQINCYDGWSDNH